MQKEKQSNQANDTRIHIFPIKPLHFLLKDISIFESITPATRRHDINILVPTYRRKLTPMAKIGRGFQLLVYLQRPNPTSSSE